MFGRSVTVMGIVRNFIISIFIAKKKFFFFPSLQPDLLTVNKLSPPNDPPPDSLSIKHVNTDKEANSTEECDL